MADIFLIRHGQVYAPGDVLYGRKSGLHLTETGRNEAAEAAGFLKTAGIDIILSSPMERTRETAAFIADIFGLEIIIQQEFNEVEIGEWTGRTYNELEEDPRWRRFNTFRSGTTAPGGESIMDVQCRMISGIRMWRESLPDGRICVVSHADPIKTVLLYFLGMPLELISRIEICTGSITLLSLYEDTAILRRLNYTGENRIVQPR